MQKDRKPLEGHSSEEVKYIPVVAPDEQHTVDDEGLNESYPQLPPTQSLPTVQTSLALNFELAHEPPTQALLKHIESVTPQSVSSG